MIYCYLRVSSLAQDEQNQRVGVLRKASELNVCIDKYYIDKVSGATDPDKRNLGRLLKVAKAGDVIIVSELSRFGRRLFMLFRILESLLKKGVRVYSVKENYNLDDSLQARIMAFAFGMAAEIERDLISMRTREALSKRKADGVHLGRPFGAKIEFHKLTDHKDHILKLYHSGVPKARIARKYRVTDKTLRKYIRLWNV